MLTYDLTDTGKLSLYEYIYKCIKNDISGGVLKAGEKMPSKRLFANNLGVSVITVENAYAQLVAEGYIYSFPKRGFFVSDVIPDSLTGGKKSLQQQSADVHEKISYFADFSSSRADSSLFPFSIWSKVIREVLADSRISLMTKSPCGGIMALRESIADYHREFRGTDVRPEQIIVGAGTEYLYGLLIQLLGNHKIYAVENPGYRKVGQISRSLGAECIPLELDGFGLRADLLAENKIDVVHVTPSHQFPTGIVMPVSRRKELLDWASAAEGRYIVEDDYDSELRLSGQALPSIQSMDTHESVIYMNTFTRSLCSTVRISYMILPEHLVRSFNEKLSFYSCTVSNFEQYTLSRFISEGKFESHVNRLRSFYRKKRDMLIEAINAGNLGSIAKISGGEAGLHFLMELDTSLSENTVVERAASKGISLIPLSKYYEGEAKTSNIYVMSYSSVDTTNCEEIMERIYRSAV